MTFFDRKTRPGTDTPAPTSVVGDPSPFGDIEVDLDVTPLVPVAARIAALDAAFDVEAAFLEDPVPAQPESDSEGAPADQTGQTGQTGQVSATVSARGPIPGLARPLSPVAPIPAPIPAADAQPDTQPDAQPDDGVAPAPTVIEAVVDPEAQAQAYAEALTIAKDPLRSTDASYRYPRHEQARLADFLWPYAEATETIPDLHLPDYGFVTVPPSDLFAVLVSEVGNPLG